jgi:hypothetical protein
MGKDNNAPIYGSVDGVGHLEEVKERVYAKLG